MSLGSILGSVGGDILAGFGGQLGQNLGGGLFGGGGTNRYGFDESTSSSMGGSSGRQWNESRSVTNPDFVWGAQAPFLQQLWGAGAGLLGQGGNQDMAQQMFEQGMRGFDQMLNPGSNPLLDIYAQDLNRNLTQQLMPTLEAEGIASGMIGGSRHGIGQAMLASEAQRNLQDFAGQQYQADMDRMLGAMAQLPGFAQFGMGIPWQGLERFAGILGSPVVLGGGGYSETSGGGVSSSFDTSSSHSVGGDSSKRGDIYGGGGIASQQGYGPGRY